MSSRHLTALIRLAPAERRILFLALWLLPLAGMCLRRLGLRRTCVWLQRSDREGKRPLDVGHDWARTAARMVDIAARHLPYRPACLPRSLVLWGLLIHRGLHARLVIGVAKPGGEFAAHAWVELDRSVLNDDDQVRRHYAPIHWQATDRPACGAR